MTKSNPNLSTPLLVSVAPSGVRPKHYDMRALLYIGGAKLSPAHSTSDITRRLLGRPVVQRAPLIKALFTAICGRVTEGVSKRTIASELSTFRKFWAFCESTNLPLVAGDRLSLQNAVSEWQKALNQDVMHRRIQQRTLNGAVWTIARWVAPTLNISCEEFLGRNRPISPRGKYQSVEHEKLDVQVAEQFLLDMADICKSISVESIMGPWPLAIKFRDGSRALYSQGGRKPKYPLSETPALEVNKFRGSHQSPVSSQRRGRAISMRTQAEFLRFLGITGMNLQPAATLVLSDVHFRSVAAEYIVRGFKNRAGSSVEFRIPKSYRHHFQDWLAFRKAVFYEESAMRLFPFFDANGDETHGIAERGFRTIQHLLEQVSKPYVNPRLLRYFRAQRALRSVVTGEDLRKIASDLQHSLPTLLQSYAQGSQAIASAELGAFISTIPALAKAQKLRAGGACIHPKTPAPLAPNNPAVPQPDCINPAGCFFCAHYRAVESYDCLHSILSYKEYLRLRVGTSSNDLRSWETVVPTMHRIDSYVQQIIAARPDMEHAAARAMSEIKAGNPHPRWRGWIELFLIPTDL